MLGRIGKNFSDWKALRPIGAFSCGPKLYAGPFEAPCLEREPKL